MSRANRWFRALLRLFPADFRGDFGDDMAATFDAHRRDVLSRGGRLAAVAFWVDTIRGVLTTAPREHWDGVAADIRYAIRTLRRNPGFTAVAVLTLAVGTGATTAIFSLVRAVFLQPLPYRDPGRLVVIWDRIVGAEGTSKLFAQYRDLTEWQEHTHSFERLGGWTWTIGEPILTAHGAPRSVLAVASTLELFEVLGIKAGFGRTFDQRDRTSGCTVVLAHHFWQDALGRTPLPELQLALDDQACTAVGVMPADFVFFPEPTDLWVLMRPTDPLIVNPEHTGGLAVFGRLKPTVTLAAAQAEVQALSRGLDRGIRWSTQMAPVVYPLQEEFVFLARPSLRMTLVTLLGAVGFVLLIACVNVANLSLGRAVPRQRDLAIRVALGSGRARLVRQLLIESLLLATMASALGTILAVAAIHAFRSINPIQLPVGARVAVDQSVLAFAAALAIITTTLFGLLPAWKSSRVDLQSALKSGGRGDGSGPHTQRLIRTLIVGELALSLVLLVGAALLIESVAHYAAAPLGFTTAGLLTDSVKLPAKHYLSATQRVAYVDRLMERLAAAPAIESAAVSTVLPLFGPAGTNVLVIEGRRYPVAGTAVHDIGEQLVTPDYFAVMGIPVLRGRGFRWEDRGQSPPVAIINESVRRKYFPDDDAIGRRIRFFGDLGPNNPWLTIIGVAETEKRVSPYYDMRWDEGLTVYHPLAQKSPGTALTLLLRLRSDRAEGTSVIPKLIANVDPDVVVGRLETAQHSVDRYVAYPHFRAVVMSGFAAVALLLATVGLYGVLSQLVAQRTPEIGVRIALGATPQDVLRLVVKEGLRLSAFGIGVGLLMAAWLGRFLSSVLFGVSAEDPRTLAVISLALIAVALVATLIPARRAAATDPLVAIRAE